MMRLTCFGKYGPYPKAGCACSCYMLTYEGRKVIIDLGCGSLSKLLGRAGIHEIDALVLSHLHADHMGDALTLRYALDAAKKLKKRDKPLPVYMPDMPAAEAGLLYSHKMMDVQFIRDGSTFNICGMDSVFSLMPHAVPSFAVSFAANGKKFVYSGDTSYNETLPAFARNADMLLMEAAFLTKNKPEGAAHVSAFEAALIAKEANAKNLLLTHIFPEYDETEILEEARQNYKNARIIEELKTYEV